MKLAAGDVGAKVLAIAAHLLNLNAPDQLRLASGAVERLVGGAWSPSELTLAGIARIAYLDPLRLPLRMQPGLEAHCAYDPPVMTFSNAAHFCEVELHPATGRVDILRYLIVEELRHRAQRPHRRGPAARRDGARHRRRPLRAARL